MTLTTECLILGIENTNYITATAAREQFQEYMKKGQ